VTAKRRTWSDFFVIDDAVVVYFEEHDATSFSPVGNRVVLFLKFDRTVPATFAAKTSDYPRVRLATVAPSVFPVFAGIARISVFVIARYANRFRYRYWPAIDVVDEIETKRRDGVCTSNKYGVSSVQRAYVGECCSGDYDVNTKNGIRGNARAGAVSIPYVDFYGWRRPTEEFSRKSLVVFTHDEYVYTSRDETWTSRCR